MWFQISVVETLSKIGHLTRTRTKYLYSPLYLPQVVSLPTLPSSSWLMMESMSFVQIGLIRPVTWDMTLDAKDAMYSLGGLFIHDHDTGCEVNITFGPKKFVSTGVFFLSG